MASKNEHYFLILFSFLILIIHSSESAPAINSSDNKAIKSQGETSSQSEDELSIDQNYWEESISNANGKQNEIEIEPANSPADNHHHSLSVEHLSNQSPKSSASDTVQQTVIGTQFSTPTTIPYNNEIEEVHSTPTAVPYNNEIEEVHSTPTAVPYNNEIEEVQISSSEALSNDSEYPVLGTLSSFLDSMFEFIGGTPSTSSPVRASNASTECSVFLPLSPLSKAIPDSSEVEPCPVPSPFADTAPKAEENGNSQPIVGTAHSSPEEMVEKIDEQLEAQSHGTMASSSSEKTMTTARSSFSQLSKSSGQTDETAFFTPDVFSRNSEQEEIFSLEEMTAENPAESEEKMAKEEAQKTAKNEKQLKKQKSKSRFFCCCN